MIPLLSSHKSLILLAYSVGVIIVAYTIDSSQYSTSSAGGVSKGLSITLISFLCRILHLQEVSSKLK